MLLTELPSLTCNKSTSQGVLLTELPSLTCSKSTKHSSETTLCARLLLLQTVSYNTLKQRVIHFLKRTVNISVAKQVFS